MTFFCLKNSKETGNDSTDEADPKTVCPITSLLKLFFCLGYQGRGKFYRKNIFFNTVFMKNKS